MERVKQEFLDKIGDVEPSGGSSCDLTEWHSFAVNCCDKTLEHIKTIREAYDTIEFTAIYAAAFWLVRVGEAFTYITNPDCSIFHASEGNYRLRETVLSRLKSLDVLRKTRNRILHQSNTEHLMQTLLGIESAVEGFSTFADTMIIELALLGSLEDISLCRPKRAAYDAEPLVDILVLNRISESEKILRELQEYTHLSRDFLDQGIAGASLPFLQAWADMSRILNQNEWYDGNFSENPDKEYPFFRQVLRRLVHQRRVLAHSLEEAEPEIQKPYAAVVCFLEENHESLHKLYFGIHYCVWEENEVKRLETVSETEWPPTNPSLFLPSYHLFQSDTVFTSVATVVTDRLPAERTEEEHTDNIIGSKLERVQVPKQGNCLYDAIALYLGQDVQLLRNIIAANLEHNIETYRNFIILPEGKTVQDYIEDIRSSNTWGGDLEISLLIRLLDRPIVSIGPDGRIVNRQVLEQSSGTPIFVYYDNINHYDGLILKNGHTAQEILSDLQETSVHTQGSIHLATPTGPLTHDSEDATSVQGDNMRLKPL